MEATKKDNPQMHTDTLADLEAAYRAVKHRIPQRISPSPEPPFPPDMIECLLCGFMTSFIDHSMMKLGLCYRSEQPSECHVCHLPVRVGERCRKTQCQHSMRRAVQHG